MQNREAFYLLQQGKLEQARDLCAALLRQDPPNANTCILMSAIQQRLGDRPAATRYLLDAAGLQAGNTVALLGTIKALRTIGALDEAGHLLDQLDSNQPEVAVSRAQLQWQNGEYAQALAGFEAAAQRWPAHPEAVFARCRALLRLAKTRQAEQALVAAARLWPENAEARRLLAVLELDQGAMLNALEHLQGKIPAEPAEGLPQKMLAALHQLSNPKPSPRADAVDPAQGVLDRSFAWANSQADRIHWFGTNSGLLQWAVNEIPAGLSGACPIIECGVYHGFSLQMIADRSQRPIHGFDSFEGLPETWKPGEPAGSYSTQGRLPETASHVQLHRGWFEDTLPAFAAQLEAPIALLHVDCDLYSSTCTVLQHLAPRLAPGGILVFDDYLSYEGYEQHEFRAAQEYFAASPQRFELVGAVLLGRAVAYRLSSG